MGNSGRRPGMAFWLDARMTHFPVSSPCMADGSGASTVGGDATVVYLAELTG
jgi:hypothetical protein